MSDKKEQEKKERLLTALDKGMVMIHLDARRPGVLVPKALQGEAHLRLNLSYRFDPPDLTVGDWGVRSTLSFGGSRFKVAVPWSALFAITSQVSREFWLYPDDMPQELIQQAVHNARANAERDEAGEGAEGGEGPGLAVVTETGEEDAEAPPKLASASRPRTLLQEIAGEKPKGEDGDEQEKPRTRGHLRVIK